MNALTALSFGIAIGNLQYFEPKLLERVIPNHSIVLLQDEKLFLMKWFSYFVHSSLFLLDFQYI
ncbi:MAG: hypothetical protein IPJ26_05170 [Bacteroidetes bacterium]|nr:hypothetical protein [Bacteroidota bacterium]